MGAKQGCWPGRSLARDTGWRQGGGAGKVIQGGKKTTVFKNVQKDFKGEKKGGKKRVNPKIDSRKKTTRLTRERSCFETNRGATY